jgi:hypothetical protein
MRLVCLPTIIVALLLLRFVKSRRVDYALSDNLSFAQQNDDALQFSKSALVVTPVTLYLNPACNIMDLFH